MSATRAPSSPPPKPPADRSPASRVQPAPASWPALDVLVVMLPGTLALVLTLVGLGSRSLWLDEGATIAIASQHGAALWHAIAHDGGNMLAYYLLEHVIVDLFGPGVVAARLPSVLATAATAALVSAIALRLFRSLERRRWMAAGAGTLTAVSLPLVFWGQDARGYALMVALVCGSFLAFVVVLEEAADGGRRRAVALVAYVLTTTAAIYVGFDAALVVAAELAVLAGRRERVRIVSGCLVVVALACVPLAVLALDRGSGQLFWVPGLGGPVLGQAATTLLSAGLSPNFHYTATSTATAVLSGLLILVACGACLRGDWRRRLPALWLVVPLLLGLAAALAGEPIELARAGILLIPAVALLIVWALAHPRVPVIAGAVVLIAVLGLRVLQLAPSYGTSPEDWHAAAAYVATHSQGGACVAFYPQDGRMPFDLYLRGTAGAAGLRPVLPDTPWSRLRPFVERYRVPSPAGLGTIENRCRALWLIASHQGQRHATPASAANLRRYEALLRQLGRGYPRRAEHRFGYAAVVRVTRFSR